jgi:hypothetical protein
VPPQGSLERAVPESWRDEHGAAHARGVEAVVTELEAVSRPSAQLRPPLGEARVTCFGYGHARRHPIATGAVLLRAASLHFPRSAVWSTGMKTIRKPYDDPENINLCEQFYRETRNPIHAWAAWSLSRKNELPIPEWVAEYFDTCFDAIYGIAKRIGLSPIVHQIAGKTPPDSDQNVDIPAAIAKALGFSKGRGCNNAFTEWMAINEKVLIGRLVAAQIADGKSLSAAAAGVAFKLKISESTAERAFRGLGDAGSRRVKKLRSLAGEAESGT